MQWYNLFMAFFNLKCLSPYPLIATSDSKGNIVIWGSRGSRWPETKLSGFMNQTTLHAELETINNTNSSNTFSNDNRSFSSRRLVPCENAAIDEMLCAKEISDCFENHSDCDRLPAMKHYNSERRRSSDSSSDEKSPRPTNTSAATTNVTATTRISSNNDSNNNSTTNYNNSSVEYTSRILEYFKATEKKWGRVLAAQSIAFDPTGLNLYTVDDLGKMRCFFIGCLILDLGGPELMKTSINKLKKLCQKRYRDYRSAAPPVILNRECFLVENKLNPSNYLGIDFIFTITAHDDRIVSCNYTLHGILTCGSDLLVKIWDFNGICIGILLNSIPIGSKNPSWKLNIDAENLIKKETLELEKVLDKVEILKSKNHSLNQIELLNIDINNIDPSVETNSFSQSDLRKRIEKSTKILGINFSMDSTNPENYQTKKPVFHSYLDNNTSTTTTNNNNNNNVSITKPNDTALNELKSSLPSVDYNEKNKLLTILQKKRKKNKIILLANNFETKHSIHTSDKIIENCNKINRQNFTPNNSINNDNKVNHGDLHDEMNTQYSSIDSAATTSSTTTSRTNNNKKQLSHPSTTPTSTLAIKNKTLPGTKQGLNPILDCDPFNYNGKFDSSNNVENGSYISIGSGRAATANALTRYSNKNVHSSTVSLSALSSFLAPTISSGMLSSSQRIDSMNNVCNQYISYNKLDKALDAAQVQRQEELPNENHIIHLLAGRGRSASGHVPTAPRIPTAIKQMRQPTDHDIDLRESGHNVITLKTSPSPISRGVLLKGRGQSPVLVLNPHVLHASPDNCQSNTSQQQADS